MTLTKLLIFLLFTCLPAGMAFAFLLFISPSPAFASHITSRCNYTITTPTGRVHVNETVNVTVTMKNEGAGWWTRSEPNPYLLGAQQPENDPNWGDASGADSRLGSRPTRVTLSSGIPPGGSDIPPGGTATFNFPAKAPDVPGEYRFSWQMLQEGVDWSGEMCAPNITVFAVAPPPPPGPPLGSECSSYLIDGKTPLDHGPLTLGGTHTISITMKNLGTDTWTPGGFSLRATLPTNQFWGTTGGTDTGLGDKPTNLPITTNIPQNSPHSFSFSVTAPNIQGDYLAAYIMNRGNIPFGANCRPTLCVGVCGGGPPPPPPPGPPPPPPPPPGPPPPPPPPSPCKCDADDILDPRPVCTTRTVCGQDVWDTYAPACEGTKAIYNSFASQNSSCEGKIYCASEDSRCAVSPVVPCDPARGGIESVFGCITAPAPLKGYVEAAPSGGGGIGLFLSNLIKLIFAIAAIVLLFMLIWGAYEWITSGGDKERIMAARGRIMHGLIGLALFACAFAVMAVLGTFTGFTFFESGPAICEDKYYYDPAVPACIHKFSTSPSCSPYIFDPLPIGDSSCEDKYYYDPAVSSCIHKYATSPACVYNFINVDNGCCGR